MTAAVSRSGLLWGAAFLVSALASPPSALATQGGESFAGKRLLEKGALRDSASADLRAAISKAPEGAALTLVVCLGHPESPRGDAIAALGKKLVGMAGKARAGVRVNWVARPDNETLCPAGVRIEWRRTVAKPPQGHVIWARGDARVVSSLGITTKAKPGTNVFSGDRLITGTNSGCALSMKNGGNLSLRAKSSLTIGQTKARRSQVNLVAGRLWSRFTKLLGVEGHDVVTANATAGVRGTVYRVTAANDALTRLETLEGNVGLGSDGAPIEVKAGFGGLVEGEKVIGPVPLLNGPLRLRPTKGAHAVGAQISWRAVEGAAQYRVELASDVQFMRLVYETEGGDTSAALPALEPGEYYWRVSAIDDKGLVGLPSQLFRIELKPAK